MPRSKKSSPVLQALRDLEGILAQCHEPDPKLLRKYRDAVEWLEALGYRDSPQLHMFTLSGVTGEGGVKGPVVWTAWQPPPRSMVAVVKNAIRLEELAVKAAAALDEGEGKGPSPSWQELNERLKEHLRKHGSLGTAPAMAEQYGTSASLVKKCPAWKSWQAELRKRNPAAPRRAGQPRRRKGDDEPPNYLDQAESKDLSPPEQAARNEERQRLIAEQKRDAEAPPIGPEGELPPGESPRVHPRV